jgi:hypothetical protein
LKKKRKKTILAKLSNKIAITNEFLFHHFSFFFKKKLVFEEDGKKVFISIYAIISFNAENIMTWLIHQMPLEQVLKMFNRKKTFFSANF